MHTGGIWGFSTYVLFLPNDGLGIVTLVIVAVLFAKSPEPRPRPGVVEGESKEVGGMIGGA